MKRIILGIGILFLVACDAVTTEALYGPGWAYHAHTRYGLQRAGVL